MAQFDIFFEMTIGFVYKFLLHISIDQIVGCHLIAIRIVTPNEVTAAAIEEGRRIAYDSSVKGYTNMDDLKAALEK